MTQHRAQGTQALSMWVWWGCSGRCQDKGENCEVEAAKDVLHEPDVSATARQVMQCAVDPHESAYVPHALHDMTHGTQQHTKKGRGCAPG